MNSLSVVITIQNVTKNLKKYFFNVTSNLFPRISQFLNNFQTF